MGGGGRVGVDVEGRCAGSDRRHEPCRRESPTPVVSPTIALTPVNSVALLIAAAFEIAEPAAFEVEKVSSAALVARIVVKLLFAVFEISRPVMLRLAATPCVEVLKTCRPSAVV